MRTLFYLRITIRYLCVSIEWNEKALIEFVRWASTRNRYYLINSQRRHDYCERGIFLYVKFILTSMLKQILLLLLVFLLVVLFLYLAILLADTNKIQRENKFFLFILQILMRVSAMVSFGISYICKLCLPYATKI